MNCMTEAFEENQLQNTEMPELGYREACLRVLKESMGTPLTTSSIRQRIEEKKSLGEFRLNTSGGSAQGAVRKALERVFKSSKTSKYCKVQIDNRCYKLVVHSEKGPKNSSKYSIQELTYKESDLYELVRTACNFMDYSQIHKHETSKGKGQILHPDVIGLSLVGNFIPNTPNSQLKLLNVMQAEPSFHSIEVKHGNITKTPKELEESIKQTERNGRWANFNWLLLFDVEEELVQLAVNSVKSFGIGILQLYTSPLEVIMRAKPVRSEIDHQHLSELVRLVDGFDSFINESASIISNTIDNQMPGKLLAKSKSTCEQHCRNKRIPLVSAQQN